MSASDRALFWLICAASSAALFVENPNGWLAAGFVWSVGFFMWDFGHRFLDRDRP